MGGENVASAPTLWPLNARYPNVAGLTQAGFVSLTTWPYTDPVNAPFCNDTVDRSRPVPEKSKVASMPSNPTSRAPNQGLFAARTWTTQSDACGSGPGGGVGAGDVGSDAVGEDVSMGVGAAVGSVNRVGAKVGNPVGLSVGDGVIR